MVSSPGGHFAICEPVFKESAFPDEVTDELSRPSL